MGQYYIAVFAAAGGDDFGSNIVAVGDAGLWNNGVKLMEHSWHGNAFMNAMTSYLLREPRHVVWAGDYADAESNSDINLYSIGCTAMDDEQDLGLTPTPDAFHDGDTAAADLAEAQQVRWLLNHSKQQYVDLFALPLSSVFTTAEGEVFEYRVHPLSLLVADGNGRGGGDYGDEYEGISLVGAWARDLIGVSSETDFDPRASENRAWTELVPNFSEM